MQGGEEATHLAHNQEIGRFESYPQQPLSLQQQQNHR